jgi:hypothetical protein
VQTSLKSLFERFRSKPEWQHPDPLVRAAAVLRLHTDDRQLLKALARDDADARVRRAAVKRLSDTETLVAIAIEDADPSVREEAASALLAIALHSQDAPACLRALDGLADPRQVATVAKAAPLEATRRAALLRLSDARSLGTVVREAQDQAIRLLALDRITDAVLLASLALNSETKTVALAALEKVEDTAALKSIAARAKVGAVSRRARARLEAQESVAAPQERAAPVPAATLSEEDRADYERFEAARLAEEERQAERERARAARTALCEAVEAAAAADVLRIVEESRTAWDALPPWAGSEAETIRARFEAACAEGPARHEAWAAAEARRARVAELCAEAERAAEAADLAEAKARLAAIQKEVDAPDGEAAAAREPLLGAGARVRAREAEAKAGEAQREQANRSRLLGLAARLETLAAAPNPGLRDVERSLREAKEAVDNPGALPSRRDRETLLARLEAGRKGLYPRLVELRQDADWKRWANVSVQEELAGLAEALLAETDGPDADLEEAARKLRELDARWKEAAEAPKEKGDALWQRFKGPRDLVRSRTEAFFARQAEEQAANLVKRQAICERAEALAESTDWLATAEEIKKLQAEWKAIGPVARAQTKPVWERFRKACDRFFNRRDESRRQRQEEWSGNQAKKEALCAQAEALALSTDWETAAAEIKRLQAEWRTIGAVKRSRSEALWQRFRTACDAFFERYKRRDSIAREALRAGREALCTELEGLLSLPEGSPAADLGEKVQTLLASWRQASPLPPEDAALFQARFRKGLHALVAAAPDRFQGTELDPDVSRRKMEKLCVRVESLLAPESAAGAESLASQLKNALATNTIGGKAEAEARRHAAAADVQAARAAWERLGPVPGPEGESLASRFEAACRRVAG